MQQLGHRVAGVLVIDRAVFRSQYFAPVYRRGQHVTILGKTGTGKTQLGYELLDEVASPKLPALNMVIKPKDDSAAQSKKKPAGGGSASRDFDDQIPFSAEFR